MKVEYTIPHSTKEKGPELGALDVGTIFSGAIKNYTGTFLRAYGVVVHLDNPRNTWDMSHFEFERVTNYQLLDGKFVVTGVKANGSS